MRNNPIVIIGELFCEICQNVYSSKKSLNHHRRHVHSDKGGGKRCEYCNVKDRNLRRHKGRYHAKEEAAKASNAIPSNV
jgi:hypothetical protein